MVLKKLSEDMYYTYASLEMFYGLSFLGQNPVERLDGNAL